MLRMLYIYSSPPPLVTFSSFSLLTPAEKASERMKTHYKIAHTSTDAIIFIVMYNTIIYTLSCKEYSYECLPGREIQRVVQ